MDTHYYEQYSLDSALRNYLSTYKISLEEYISTLFNGQDSTQSAIKLARRRHNPGAELPWVALGFGMTHRAQDFIVTHELVHTEGTGALHIIARRVRGTTPRGHEARHERAFLGTLQRRHNTPGDLRSQHVYLVQVPNAFEGYTTGHPLRMAGSEPSSQSYDRFASLIHSIVPNWDFCCNAIPGFDVTMKITPKDS